MKVTPEQVKQLHDEGQGWRRIARTLEIGKTTAARLYKAVAGQEKAS